MKLSKVLPILAFVGLIAFKLKSKKNKVEGANEDKFILVTGASTGIGRAISESLAGNGYKVFATVRKDTDAEILASLSSNITPIKMDVTNHESILKAKEVIKEKLGDNKLFSLINNAGIAVAGPMELISIDEVRKQFEVNYFGVMDTTQVFFELLDRNHSKIINMSSIGGKIANPFMGPYNSSKFALEAMSDSLRRELVATNIDVVVIEPGMIVTPIWDKADEIDADKYEGSIYKEHLDNLKEIVVSRGKQGAPAKKVSDTILKVLRQKNNKARYWVSGNPLVEVFIPRILPDRTLDFMVSKMLKLR